MGVDEGRCCASCSKSPEVREMLAVGHGVHITKEEHDAVT